MLIGEGQADFKFVQPNSRASGVRNTFHANSAERDLDQSRHRDSPAIRTHQRCCASARDDAAGHARARVSRRIGLSCPVSVDDQRGSTRPEKANSGRPSGREHVDRVEGTSSIRCDFEVGRSPAWGPLGFCRPCFFSDGLRWAPADAKSGGSHFRPCGYGARARRA